MSVRLTAVTHAVAHMQSLRCHLLSPSTTMSRLVVSTETVFNPVQPYLCLYICPCMRRTCSVMFELKLLVLLFVCASVDGQNVPAPTPSGCVSPGEFTVGDTTWNLCPMTSASACFGRFFNYSEAVAVCAARGWSLPSLSQATSFLAATTAAQQQAWLPRIGGGGGDTGNCVRTNGSTVWYLSDGASDSDAIACPVDGTTGIEGACYVATHMGTAY